MVYAIFMEASPALAFLCDLCEPLLSWFRRMSRTKGFPEEKWTIDIIPVLKPMSRNS